MTVIYCLGVLHWFAFEVMFFWDQLFWVYCRLLKGARVITFATVFGKCASYSSKVRHSAHKINIELTLKAAMK